MNERELEKPLKALANKRRLAILGYLKRSKESSVGDIAHKIELSYRSTSKHLGILSSAGIVEKEQRSTVIYYHLNPVIFRDYSNIISKL